MSAHVPIQVTDREIERELLFQELVGRNVPELGECFSIFLLTRHH